LNRFSKNDFKVTLDATARVGLVGSEPGGANILLAFSNLVKGSKAFFFQGPSSGLIDPRINLERETLSSFISNGPTAILLGTSMNFKDSELPVIEMARLYQIPTYVFIDNWIDYRNRFRLGTKYIFPDCIVAGDIHAYLNALNDLSETRVVYFPNPYISEQIKNIEIFENSRFKGDYSKKRVLILTEPTGTKIESSEQYQPYSSQDALRAALKFVEFSYPESQVIVRLHPSENITKYKEIDMENPKVEFFEGLTPISQDIAMSHIVLGTNSMGLYIVSLAGKLAISVIPKGGFPCTIPYDSVIKKFVEIDRRRSD